MTQNQKIVRFLSRWRRANVKLYKIYARLQNCYWYEFRRKSQLRRQGRQLRRICLRRHQQLTSLGFW